MRIGNRASISAGKQAKGYQLITSVADDGKVSVSLSNEKGYFEVIEVQGRETRPLDDLEYTKTALLMDQFVSPLLDAVDDRIESTGKKKDAK
jgi:hypothetical protein